MKMFRQMLQDFSPWQPTTQLKTKVNNISNKITEASFSNLKKGKYYYDFKLNLEDLNRENQKKVYSQSWINNKKDLGTLA